MKVTECSKNQNKATGKKADIHENFMRTEKPEASLMKQLCLTKHSETYTSLCVDSIYSSALVINEKT
jgi:hypothetical protein